MFEALFKNRQPAHRRIPMTGTPVDLYRKLYQGDESSFLYESLESPEKRGRYSFIGGKPFLRFQSRGTSVQVVQDGQIDCLTDDPFNALKRLVGSGVGVPEVASFSGGAVGTVSYDAVRLIETLPAPHAADPSVPDLDFLFPSELVVFDHLMHTIDVICFSEKDNETNAECLADRIRNTISEAVSANEESRPAPAGGVPVRSNFTKESFCRAVDQAKEYIRAGDVFQVVLSQKMTFPFRDDPLGMYQRLRKTNPSPYMYFLKLGGRHVMGSSPEILVKLTGRTVCSRPLAGTRRRGKTGEEDRVLEAELLRDQKERAEHVMLVDLARNDLGRVCEYGTVRPTGLFEVERYSKVMHLVSNVEGRVRADCDAFDVFRACFPAGTVSGAPKVRAMEIIRELEPDDRGPYAGAIGYFGFSGDMDMCIAIRMLTVQDGTGTIQAGAGIVADSEPEHEYQESLNKARAVLAAAGQGE